jgi:hypothetical protein
MHTQPTNSEMKKITSITAVKEYFTGNTFELYTTIVVMHFSSITKRQSTKQEQLPKVERKYSWPLKLVTILYEYLSLALLYKHNHSSHFRHHRFEHVKIR